VQWPEEMVTMCLLPSAVTGSSVFTEVTADVLIVNWNIPTEKGVGTGS